MNPFMFPVYGDGKVSYEGFVSSGVAHRYYLSATGVNGMNGCYKTRRAAEIAMNSYCAQHGISVECTECDKHERKYSNHNGVRFYINRI